MGIDIKGLETPVFHDLNYKLKFKTGARSELSIFGVNGWSKVIKEKSGRNANGVRDVLKKGHYAFGHIYNGLGYKTIISEQTSFNLITGVLNIQFQNNNEIKDSTNSFVPNDIEEFDKTLLKAHVFVQNNLNKATIKSGVLFNQMFFDLASLKSRDSSAVYFRKVDITNQTRYYQLYTSTKWLPNKHFTLTGGLHSLIFELNGNYSIEPRLSVRWTPKEKHVLSFGTGLYSKLETIVTYYVQSFDDNEELQQYNKDLKLMKSIHNVLAYNFIPNDVVQFSIEGYYQYLFDVPVADSTKNKNQALYSAINDKNVISKSGLVSTGIGWNYGCDISLSVITLSKWLGKFTFSVYDSKYRASDGVIRNTLWNNTFSTNLILGKEIILGKNDLASIRLGANTNIAGGKRFGVIDLEASIEEGDKVLDPESSYNERGPLMKEGHFIIVLMLCSPMNSN